MTHRDVSISTINSTMKMTEDQLSSLRDNLICYCRRFSGGDAEDVVQTTLLKALPLLQGQQSHANVTAFLRRIAKNTWLDWLRHEKYCQPFKSVSFAAEAGETSLEHTLHLADALRLVMVKLTSQQQKVFFLCEVFEHTAVEAAKCLGISPGAVKASLHRARTRLSEESTESFTLAIEQKDIQQDVLRAYVAAFQSADIRALLHLCDSGTVEAVQATTYALIHATTRKSPGGTRHTNGSDILMLAV